MGRCRSHPRPGRTLVAVLFYMLGFALLLAIVSSYYLVPALIARHTALPDERRLLAANSTLILALLLFILLVGLLLTFRIGRWFFPRTRDPIQPTEYIDVWKEAGRRLKVDDDEENGEQG
jgi:hypothetical protein